MSHELDLVFGFPQKRKALKRFKPSRADLALERRRNAEIFMIGRTAGKATSKLGSAAYARAKPAVQQGVAKASAWWAKRTEPKEVKQLEERKEVAKQEWFQEKRKGGLQ